MKSNLNNHAVLLVETILLRTLGIVYTRRILLALSILLTRL